VGDDKGEEIAKGAGAGLVTGGILGGLAGWLVGVGALAIPGVGPIIAKGALGTALSGAAEDRADVTMPGTSPLDIPERTTADVTERADR
jgi:hypothetical protein